MDLLIFYSLILIYLLLCIAHSFVPHIINKSKERKLRNKLLYNVKNFTRYCNSTSKRNYTMPSKIKKLYFISLANKFCVISIDFIKEELIYYDKINDKAFSINNKILFRKSLENLFNKLCEQFNFETKIEDILAISENIFIKFEENIVELNDKQREKINIRNVSVNDLSIAELIELPGINIGKANKIKKYIQNKKFDSLQNFIHFAKISKENEKEIKRMFNLDTRYVPKKWER